MSKQVFIKSELKVGVIYVKDGQFSEEEILDNNEHSPLFDEFLQIIGDKVRLKGINRLMGHMIHRYTLNDRVWRVVRKKRTRCDGTLCKGVLIFCCDVSGFDKYKGGLDTVHDLTGLYSVYTHWRGIEIMFHVSTLLPYEKNDPQKV